MDGAVRRRCRPEDGNLVDAAEGSKLPTRHHAREAMGHSKVGAFLHFLIAALGSRSATYGLHCARQVVEAELTSRCQSCSAPPS